MATIENLQMHRRRSLSFSVPEDPSDDDESRINQCLDEVDGVINPACSIEDMSHIQPRKNSSPDFSLMRRKRKGSVLTLAGAAIVIRDGEKSYRSGNPVLSGLDMTVPCGSIYALLGSSGCGKTTVLSCIVGTRKLDRGDIWLFGRRPGDKTIGVPGKNIGYMPQDISLYLEFTIEETLVYFGTLCEMTKGEIKNGIKFLRKLLDLPDHARRIGTLSGGQQRRVSFATALIHDPELLILDEPTVGVDPLLRQNIWIHLGKLVSTKRTTVIITTHYIEEARQANNIGIMRSGRLLAERPPEDLICEFGTSSLEKIVLSLCRKDTAQKLNPKDIAAVAKKSEKQDVESNSNEERSPDVPMARVLNEPELTLKNSINRIRALAGKNFAIISRNLMLLLFVVGISAIMLIIVCISIGGDPTYVPVGLVNHEVDYKSICSNLSRVEGECNVENLSCQYIRNIKEDAIDLRVYETDEDAMDDIHRGKIWGYISFPVDFSTIFYERTSSGSNTDEATLNASAIIVRLDETNKQITLPLKKVLQDAFIDFSKAMLADCGFDARQAEPALMYNTPLFGRDDTDFREFLAPGLSISIIFFFAIIAASIRHIKEKKCGMLERSLVLGVNTWEILVAYSISEFCVLATQAVLTFLVFTVIFQIEVKGFDAYILILFILAGYGGVSMGMFLGTICCEEIQAAILAMAAFFPNFILSGLIWPEEGMPVALQYFSNILPCTLSAEASRSITSRGWEFTHPNVWPGFAILVGYIIGFFVLTAVFQKFFKK